MKFLVVVLFPLANAFLHPNSNKLISRGVDQSHSLADPSKAACHDYCEAGWTYFDETYACYRHFIHATFESAEFRCQLWGGHLTSIHNEKENFFVAELARSGMPIRSSKQGTWIGLERHEHSNWTWTDGTEVDLLLWATGQPNNQDGIQKCVQLYADPSEDDIGAASKYQRWVDIPCDFDLRSFVCKKMPLH